MLMLPLLLLLHSPHPFRATGLLFRGCSQTTRFQTHSPTEKPQTANVFAVRQRAQNGECLAPRSVPAVSQPVCFSVLCVFRPFFRTQQKTARTKQNRKPVRTREYYTRWDARTHARLNTGERPGWYAVSNVWCCLPRSQSLFVSSGSEQPSLDTTSRHTRTRELHTIGRAHACFPSQHTQQQ